MLPLGRFFISARAVPVGIEAHKVPVNAVTFDEAGELGLCFGGRDEAGAIGSL